MGLVSELFKYETTLVEMYVPQIITHHFTEGPKDDMILATTTMSVFDSLLHGKHSFGEMGETISTFRTEKALDSETTFWAMAFKNYNVLAATKELFRMIKNDRIELKLSNGESILMHQFRDKDYVPISFFGNALKSTPEFLMTPFIWPGTTLNSEMKELKVDNILGPKTLQLLEDIGYATTLNPQIIDLDMVTD